MTGRINILYISPVGERGGAETALLNVLRYHDREVFAPFVCFLKAGPFVEEVGRLGVRTFLFPTTRFRHLMTTLRAIRFIRSLIKEQRIALVFGNMAMGHLYGGLASLFTRARCVWFQHGIASLTLLDFLATLLPSEVIYVNSTFSKRAQERLCNRARRVQLLYYGIDLQRFHEKDGTHRGFSIRQKLGIHLEAPVIGNVGRFQQWKGQHVLLQAVPRVLREFPEARFLVVGDTIFGLEPEYKQTLLAMVHDLGITDAVIFPGYRNDVPELLHAVDVFVHSPILPEPFGLVIVEAMARGMPVIASNAGGIPDIVDHEVTGLLIPPGNHEELAEAIVRLLRDPALRKRLGEAGRQKAFERFSAERMTRELEQSYLEIFDAAPQRVTAGRVR